MSGQGETDKAWKKTDDIPRRFDELPSEPEWVPVADVIRTQREEEARQEAQKLKIRPPLDSDSDTETPNVKVVKEKKPPMHKKNENVQRQESAPKISSVSMPPTVDDVTRSMVDWALNTDNYPRRPSKHPSHHREQDEPHHRQQSPPHFGLDKGQIGRHNRIHSSRPPSYNYHTQPDVLSPQRMQGHLGGASHTKPHQSTSSHKGRQPIYEEPSPDYSDEDYDAYYSRFQDVKQDDYFYQEQGYEVAPDPYFYGTGPHHDKPSYNSEYGYDDAPEDFGYEYGGPQYPHEDQRGYPSAPGHHSQMPHEVPRGKSRSNYDVLY